MRKYEIMFILDQDTKDVNAVAKKLNDILTADGGKILESAEWGLKEMAYEINHKKKGYYYIVIADTKPANITEFQRIAGIDKDVVRTLVINTETEKRYIQSTKLSKTDMSKFKEERKPRQFEKRERFPRNDEAKTEEKSTEAKAAAPKKEAAPAKEGTEKAPAKKTTTKAATDKTAAAKPVAKKTTAKKED